MTSPLSSRRRSKTPPPGETGQEALYLRSLSDRQVIVHIKLRDGETVRGWIEYFDDAMLRLTRDGQPNLFIYKHQIRSIAEAGRKRIPRTQSPETPAENGSHRRRGGALSGSAAPDLLWVPKAAAIAKEAGARLREFFSAGVETEYKGDVDLVTVADRASEKLIRERLAEAFPDHGIYGEEGTRERLEREFRWYLDPLDGTTNFAHGFPQFCVSLGLERKEAGREAGLSAGEDGTLEAAVIYDPMREELFAAERGRGAWLNGRAMRVSRTAELAEALVATGFPSRKRHASPNVHFYHEFTLRSHGVRRAGSAALDLAYVAAGRMDAFWEFNLNPWDTAAGILLVKEAGGRVTDFAGGAFRLESRETLASNRLIHEELVGFFRICSRGAGWRRFPRRRSLRPTGRRGRRRSRLIRSVSGIGWTLLIPASQNGA